MDQGNAVDFGRDENVEQRGALVNGGGDNLVGDSGAVNGFNRSKSGAVMMSDGMALGDVDTPVMSDTMASRGGVEAIAGGNASATRNEVSVMGAGVKMTGDAMPVIEMPRDEIIMNMDDAGARGRKEKRDKKILLGVLAVLLVAIVGLGVGVGVMNERGEKKVYSDGSLAAEAESINDANAFCNMIWNKYEDDDMYSFSDAIGDFDDGLLVGDTAYRVYYVMCYATFVYEYGDGIVAASSLMNDVENLIGDASERVSSDYYAVFKRLYMNAGDSDMAEYYNNKIVEIQKGGIQ
ncbi:hypothetical protein IKE79_01155 [Candidatus Saccharibacteria bacterium]|nr:hypothetical protein [Candidatus Saccharibacteria bacterium]